MRDRDRPTPRVITVLFVLALRPAAALGALISDKINQWTLLVGFIPLFYSLARGGLHPFPLDARQHEEFFLTAAQSLFAVALLLRLRLHLAGAAALFGLFLVQFTLAFVNQADEAATINVLTILGWVYIGLAVALVVRDRNLLVEHARFGLLNRLLTRQGDGARQAWRGRSSTAHRSHLASPEAERSGVRWAFQRRDGGDTMTGSCVAETSFMRLSLTRPELQGNPEAYS